MTKLLIVDAFTLLIREKNVANYALLRCKTFSLKIWLCKILDKYHVCSKIFKISTQPGTGWYINILKILKISVQKGTL